MIKKNKRKSALKKSLEAEKKAVQPRFRQAETALGKQTRIAADIPDKVIRDSFTMPSLDYDLIAALKARAIKAGISTTKSEILRAGLNSLAAMSDKQLRVSLENLFKVKVGRPAPNKTD